MTHRHPTVRWAALLAVGLLAAGCDTESLLEVPDPDVVGPPVFQDPDNLNSVAAGVVREFARAYAGTQNNEGGQILLSGLFADELYHSGTFTTRQQVDARNVGLENGSATTAYFWLHRARNHGDQADGLFDESEQAGSDDHAHVLNLTGFSYVMFAENYCGGVPFSTLPIEGETVFGEANTTDEILQRAIDRFDEVLGFTGAGADELNAARVGKARALLNMGDYAGAAAAVASVPTDFSYMAGYSGNIVAAWNAVWNLVNAERRWSAGGNEGTNGLPFIFEPGGDPRVPGADNGPGFNSSIQAYAQLKYPAPGDDIPVATGIEARLVEAEAALDAGDRAGFFDAHNGARATLGLAALTDTGQTTDELVDIHFQERAYWLWLTSHRLGDLRRLVRQYDRDAATVYPIGPTIQSSTRGSQLSIPVPFSEQNNPNYDPAACDPTRA